jgi:DNA primase
MPGIDYRVVRSKIPIAWVLKLIGFEPSESSREQWRRPCPLHGSTSPGSRTFSVNLRRNAYRCFKCGSAGNQLDLWAAFTKPDLHAAAVDLCERLDVVVPWIRTLSPSTRKEHLRGRTEKRNP